MNSLLSENIKSHSYPEVPAGDGVNRANIMLEQIVLHTHY